MQSVMAYYRGSWIRALRSTFPEIEFEETSFDNITSIGISNHSDTNFLQGDIGPIWTTAEIFLLILRGSMALIL